MRRNNFDVIRLTAALMVLVSHSFSLAGSYADEPFKKWLGDYDSGGGLGVAIFFVISGFLVSGSVSHRSTDSYLRARALRILPALALVSCFDVFVIGPIFTTHSLAAYFSNWATWDHFANPLMFRTNLWLPGVFETLPVPGVNGSLWTLPAECGLYLALPALAFFGGLTRIGSTISFATCAVGYFVATGYFGLNWDNPGPQVIKGILIFNALKLSTFFFAGSALWANRHDIPLNAGGAIICVMVLYGVAHTTTAPVAYFICIPYVVIFAAYKLPVLPLEKIGDLSYGTYLFAFPVQQALVSILGNGHPIRVASLAIPSVLALAFASWRLVEARALRLKSPVAPGLRAAPEPLAHSDRAA